MIDYQKVEEKYQLSHRPFGAFVDNIIGLLNQFPIRIIGLMFLFSALIIIWHYNRLSESLTASTAMNNAEVYSEALTEFRTLYTSEVVSKLQDTIEITHDYNHKPLAIPLPATLSMELGKRIGQLESGAKVSLYSDHPFPWRKDRSPKDEFKRNALLSLRQDPLKPYFRFEELNESWSFRYATADLMRPSCVNCHNNHPQSPKRDWKSGDVRGVLEVSLPMDSVQIQVRKGIFETIILLIGIIFAGLGILALVIGGLRKSTQRAIDLSNQSERTNAELKQEIDDRMKIQKELDVQTKELERTNESLHHENDERKRAEEQIAKAYAESEESRNVLEDFDRFNVDREVAMIELKKEINTLLKEQDKPEKYDIDFDDNQTDR